MAAPDPSPSLIVYRDLLTEKTVHANLFERENVFQKVEDNKSAISIS